MEELAILVKRLREMNRDIEGMLLSGIYTSEDNQAYCEAWMEREDLEDEIRVLAKKVAKTHGPINVSVIQISLN